MSKGSKRHKKSHPLQESPVRLEKLDGREMFECLKCVNDVRHYFPWEIPRHLEKVHNLPEEAYALRKSLIPKWNKSFEEEYRKKLYDEIIIDKDTPVKSIDEETNEKKKIGDDAKKERQKIQQADYEDF
jgi:hypothetical protein